MFRNVFMDCLVVFGKRSYLGPCTLDHFLLRSLHVSKTKEVVQRAVRPCSVSLRGAGLVSIDVCDPMPGLPIEQRVSQSLIVPVPILLSAAGSLRPGLLLHTPKQHLPSEEDFCRKHGGTHFSRSR